MEPHQIVLGATILTVGLAAGVFFTFTALVIPGLMDADHRDALKGFQTIDRRLQPNPPSMTWQPAFAAAIFGPTVLTVVTVLLGWPESSANARVLAIGAAASYNLGFWLPTFLSIVPFNDRLRDRDLDTMSPTEVEELHRDFARNWRGLNLVRTVSSSSALALLIGVALAQQ